MVTGEGGWGNKNTNRPPVKLLKLSCFLVKYSAGAKLSFNW